MQILTKPSKAITEARRPLPTPVVGNLYVISEMYNYSEEVKKGLAKHGIARGDIYKVTSFKECDSRSENTSCECCRVCPGCISLVNIISHKAVIFFTDADDNPCFGYIGEGEDIYLLEEYELPLNTSRVNIHEAI